MDFAPLTQLRRQDDLPFIRRQAGVEFQVLHVDVASQLWVIRTRLAPGIRLERHRHTGEVFALTLGGAWRYLNQEEVSVAGSYLYEPAGSVHQLEVLPDSEGPADIWFAIRGANEHMHEDGTVYFVRDAANILTEYRAGCAALGISKPPILTG
jgi:2,4'-dihydroxyacetophenone dioxygenase